MGGCAGPLCVAPRRSMPGLPTQLASIFFLVSFPLLISPRDLRCCPPQGLWDGGGEEESRWPERTSSKTCGSNPGASSEAPLGPQGLGLQHLDARRRSSVVHAAALENGTRFEGRRRCLCPKPVFVAHLLENCPICGLTSESLPFRRVDEGRSTSMIAS